MLPVEQPFKTYTDLDGKALQNGYVYFGLPGQNPLTAPVTVYWDAAGTQPAAQPLRTINGYIVRAGTPANVFFSGSYSELVQDSKQIQVFYARTSDDFSIATFVSNYLNALSSSTGADQIGFIQSGIDAVATTMLNKARERVSVFDFMTAAEIADVRSGAPVLDLSTSLAKARNFLVGNASRYRLCFPSGIYRYSVSPNWGISKAAIVPEGEVRLRYVGGGNAVIIDAGGASSDLIYGLQMTKFIIEAPATAQNGIFVRGIHHADLTGLNVRGCGAAFSGLYVAFAVCTDFSNFRCSVNEGGWYLGAKPAFGINLNIRNPGETVSYCLFNNPIVEATDIGIQLVGALGNIFVGGTSEGCTTYGVFNASSASGNKFFGTDFEANTIADVYCQGAALELHGCDSTKMISFGTTAKRCILNGGQHSSILFDAGSVHCSAIDTSFNRTGFAGTFTDVGTNSCVRNVLNIIGGVRYLTGILAATPGLIANNSTGVLVVPVTGAKFGDQVSVSWDASLAGLIVSAYVTAANTVTAYLLNVSGAGITIGAGNMRAVLTRQ